MKDVDDLAQFIRRVDGNHTMGAEALAEAIVSYQMDALLTDDAIERVARELASLDPGDEWPTNIELGGNPFTGTRDDEYKHGMREQAREVLTAALGIEGAER